MIKNLFLVLMALLPAMAFSQEYEYIPFPDSGAIWSEVYQPPLDMYGNYPPPIYERFALNGEDTIINETTYKKLYIFYDSIFKKSNATYIGGIREDQSKRVYYRGDTIHFLKPSIYSSWDIIDLKKTELLLYDFSLSIGDTLKIGNFSMPDELLTISSIDTILVGESFRKIFSFDPINWVKWIEGIGNIRGLLFTSGSLPYNGIYNDLICFKQNNEILYFNNEYSECFPVLTSIETIKNSYLDIKVFPNPSNENIMFSFEEQKIERIQINDCKGRLCDSFECKLQSDFLLSIEKYQPGIYFYMATNKNGFNHTGKFVVR